ncbi:MAG: toxin-antitoxin system protein [Thermoleophilaceae bacterium]|nr:toxin-antitoxin system protein [Thermoleophilaceae bacterium]
MADTTTIRVPTETRDRLNALARKRGLSAGDLITDLASQADDRLLLAEAVAGWERMAADARMLDAYRAETQGLAAFDAALPEY